MSLQPSFMVWVVGLGILCASAPVQAADDAEANEKDTYVTEKGELAHALVIREAQGGFAGFSGQLWTIEPDGKWRRAPFLNEDVREAEARGELAADDLTALAKELKKHGLLKLAKNIGGDPMANPHVFSITFGDFQTELVLNAGAELPKPKTKGKAEDADRFAAIVRAVLKRVEKKEEGEER